MMLCYYKVHESVRDPILKTEGSACFDLPISLRNGEKVKYWREGINYDNSEPYSWKEPTEFAFEIKNNEISLIPGNVYLISTGLIFQIPAGYHMQVYLRSSSGLKKHLSIPNSVGIIDSDYREEVGLIVQVTTKSKITLTDGDLVAQGMMMQNDYTSLMSLAERPVKVESRDGGFGSTGN